MRPKLQGRFGVAVTLLLLAIMAALTVIALNSSHEPAGMIDE